MSSLALRFKELSGRVVNVADTASLTSLWWNKIETRYSEPQRYYHTLNHLESMFFYFENVKDNLQNPDLVSLAIFFHE